jgi:O-antigen/teichoic acid export membrane protein
MSSVQTGAPSPHSLFKNILQGSGLYSIAQILPTLTSLVLVPVTTRFLTRADYGIQDLLSQVSIVISALLGGYFAFALGYFYFEADPSQRQVVVGTSVIGSLALGTGAAMICLPFAGLLSSLVFPGIAAAPYLRLMLLLMPPNFALDALMGWMRVTDRPLLFVIGTAVRAFLTIACTVWFVGLLKLHVWGVLYSTTISLLITTLLLGVYWWRASGPVFDLHIFNRIARYAMPLGLSGLAMFILHFGDSFILPHYWPYGDLGIYRLAYKIAMIVSSIYGAFGIYWNAQVFSIMRRDDADLVFSRLFTYVMLGTSFVCLALIVCARPALRKIAGHDFQDAAPLVPVLVTAYFLRCISEFMRALFLFTGRPSYDAATTWIGALVCIGGYVILIPRYGVWGAAFATLLAFAVLAVVSVVWAYRLRPYRVEGSRLLKIALALAASGGVWYLFQAPTFGALALSAAIAVLIFPATLWVLRFPTPGELLLARSTVSRVLPGFSR